jgi:hypothetical protein
VEIHFNQVDTWLKWTPDWNESIICHWTGVRLGSDGFWCHFANKLQEPNFCSLCCQKKLIVWWETIWNHGVNATWKDKDAKHWAFRFSVFIKDGSSSFS